MGIFDSLSNLSPDPTQGILAAAAQMLQQSGPSRLPVGLGQIAGGGLQAFQTGSDAAQQRRMQLEQAQQAAQLHGLQIQGLTGELQDKQLGRDRQMKIQSDLSNLFQQQGSPAVATPSPMGQPQVPQMASALPGGPMSPKIGGPDWLQSYQAQQPSEAGAVPDAPKVPVTQPQQALGSSSNSTEAYANRLLKEAEVYSKNGDFAGADQRYQAASKLLPQVDKVEPATDPQSGKLVNVITFKDGTQKVSAFGVKPDFKPVDQGGKITIQDYNALAPGQSFAKSMTPGEISNANQSAARLKFDQSQAEDGTGPLTSSAVDNAAKRYNFDGTLPPMGMGKQATAGRSSILNRAAEFAGETDATGGRGGQLNNKGDIAARNSALRDYSSSGKSGQAIQAANTSLNHLETVVKLAAAQNNGDFRLFNKIANQFAAETGNTAPTNLAAALAMVAPEVSKAVIGATGTGEERAAFEKRFAGNGSPQQAIEGISTIKELLGGRLTEAERTYNRTTGKTDFREKMLSPAALSVINKASSTVAPQKTVTLADIAVTAQKSGKTTAEVTKALRDQGYTIGGQ